MNDFSLKYLRFFNYFLALVILIAALVLTRNIVNISFSELKVKPAVQEFMNKGAAPKTDIMRYAAILEENPFGPPMTLEPIAGPRPAEAQQYSPLSDLILKGTAVGPEKLSYAIVIDQKAKDLRQEIFTYGDNVFDYGILTKIERESIELTRGNAVHTVRLPVKQDTVQTTGVSVKSSSIARKVGEREYILDSRKVRQSLENPEKILTDARLLPNFVDGEQRGFRISEVIEGGLYQSLGLKNGDILLRINGLAISNPEVAMQALSALKGMNSVNLDIIRNNDKMSMNYKLR